MKDRLDELRPQYGCGPVQFSGADKALYNRHLQFDNVIDPITGDLADAAVSHLLIRAAETALPVQVTAPRSQQRRQERRKGCCRSAPGRPHFAP